MRLSRRRAPGLTILSAITAVALVLSGCASNLNSDSGTVRTRFDADPASFDPAQLVGGDDYYVSRLLFDTLLRYDDKGEIVGGLAKTWDFDALGGTIELEGDASCQDGTTIDAKVVADSLNRFASPDTKSGSKALTFGNGEVKVTAEGSDRVSIKLSEPFSELDAGLTTVASGIVCPAGLDDVEGLKNGAVRGAFSGPFDMTKLSTGVEYRLELREEYNQWPGFVAEMDGRPPETLSFSVGNDVATNANEILGGSLDLATISPTDTERFPNVALVYIGEQFVVFNQNVTSPFIDEDLRRAVARTISADAYNQVTYAGKSEIELTVGDAGMQCANTDETLIEDYDREAVQSKGLLDGVKMTYSASNTFGPNGIGAEYIYQELSDAGADVNYQLTDNSSWASLVLGPDAPSWDITLYGSVNQTSTLWTNVSRILGTAIEDGGRSMTRADNSKGERLAEQVMSADDPKAKCEYYRTLQENFLGSVDIVPLTATARFYGAAEGVEFLAPNQRIDYTTIRIMD